MPDFKQFAFGNSADNINSGVEGPEQEQPQAQETLNSNSTVKSGVDPTKTNAYAHNPSTNQNDPSYDKEEATYSELNLNDFVIPYENILQKYHNPTWNFSLYTMSTQEYNLYLDSPESDISKYIIAQSGVTGRYSINEVKMVSAGPATPGLTTNYSINTFTIEIVENGGMHLYDDFIVLSNELGYQKFMDVPLILELNFVGYDQITGEPSVIPGVNKKWGVRINSINGAATDSGSTMVYTLSLTSSRYGGSMNNESWTLKEPFSCTSSTFGDFLESLEAHLNKVEEKQRGYLRLRYPEFNNNNFYKFHIAEELYSMTLNNDVKQSPTVGNTPSGQSGSKAFSWDASKPISRVIDDVLDGCIPLHGSTESPRQFVNIIPQSRFVGYDHIRADIAYQNVYYFVKYQIGDIVSKDDLSKERFNVEYFLDNAHKEADPFTGIKKLNVKRYDYQFSGLNNEILDLELKFDQGFNIAVTRNPSSQVDVQNTRGTHTSQIIEFGDVTYNIADPEDITRMWRAKTELEQRQRDEGYVLTEEEKQFTRDTEAAAGNIQSVEGEDEQNAEIPFFAQDPMFVEDFRNTRDISIEGTRGIGIPEVKTIPVNPENTEITESGSRKENGTDDEIQRRLVRDNYYNRSFLAKIDLKVIGDPFWLGWGDSQFLEYLNRAVNGEEMNISPDDFHYANYITTEAYFLLNLKPVAAISDVTGLIELNQGSVFAQNLYRVNKVQSEFTKNGKFTQTIQGGLMIRSLRHKDQYDDSME